MPEPRIMIPCREGRHDFCPDKKGAMCCCSCHVDAMIASRQRRRILSEFEDQILELIDQNGEAMDQPMTRSDLQAVVGALVLKIAEAGKKL